MKEFRKGDAYITMTNTQRHCRALELDKILAMLADCANCADSRQLALDIEPTFDYLQTVRLMQKTSDAYSMSMRFGSPSVYGVKNVNESLKRAQKGSALTLRELLDIENVLRTIRAMSDWRKSCDVDETSLDTLFESLYPNKYMEKRITDAVLSEEELSDNASPALADLRRKMRNASHSVREQLDKMIRSSTYQKFLQEQIVTIRDGRFVVPVKSEYRGEVKGLVHSTSASGATLFIEPMAVVEANNEMKVLESKAKAEEERIILELSVEAGSFADSIIESYHSVVELDLYFAKARLAQNMKAVVPEIGDDGVIELTKARHPLIDAKKIVPIDIRLGKDFDTLVITGPNTGGKTVALKTLGLLTLMAMCGLMIPAFDGSRVSVFKNVLADIGDEQSIEQSLSTFSAHMTNIIAILSQTDDNTLVLLDELGAGTDPIEGAALAVSIIETLRQKGAKTAGTTHYAEMKMFALQTPGVENACCEFDVASLRPTYKLLIGVPGRSNAFAISEKLGMDSAIVERAKELITTENTQFEDVVSRLEESRQSMESDRELARTMKIEAQRQKKLIDDEKRRLDDEREKMLARARKEAQSIVDKVRAESQALIDELNEIKKQKDSEQFAALSMEGKIKQRTSLKKLQNLADPVTKKNISDYKPPRKLKRGDTVMVTSLNKEGVILTDPDTSGRVMVQVGIIKTKVDVSELRLVENKKVTVNNRVPATRTVTSKVERNATTELDLRGMNAEEAVMELERFIDGCVLSSMKTITIIHGKGTGVLRKAVHAALKRNKCIRTYRLGVYGEGESGVTVAELK